MKTTAHNRPTTGSGSANGQRSGLYDGSRHRRSGGAPRPACRNPQPTDGHLSAPAGNFRTRWRLTGLLFLALCGAFGIAFSSACRAADPVEFLVGEFTFERPDEFQWINPTSSMRKAELKVSDETGNAEIVFFHFGPGQGGSVDANIARWLSQFVEPTESLDAKTASRRVGSTDVTLLAARGTFLSGMPGGPTTPVPGTALRGAILASPGGDVYVKMTGPSATVEAVSDAFDKMVLDAAEKTRSANDPERPGQSG